MIIRPVEQDDAEALLAFYQSLSEEVRRVFLPPGPVTEDTIQAHLSTVANGTCVSLVLDNYGMIMGHAFIQSIDTGAPMLGIGLRDVVIGCGYGRQMMERLLAIADARRLPLTALSVVKTNYRAEALYRHMGYVRKRETTFRSRNDSWYMERVLPDKDADRRNGV